MSRDMKARRLVRAQAWTCRVPMDRPVRLGRIVYTARDYVVLKALTDDGLEGVAIGYTRATPLLASLETLCSAVLELDIRDPERTQKDLFRRFIPGWGQLVRAASLIDVALWDIAARGADQPLHRHLGARTSSVPLMAVAGYYADVRGADELIDEAAGFVEHGVGMLKLILSGADRDRDEELTAGLRDRVPASAASVGIDFHAPWNDADAAVEYCRPLDELGLRFIEDPFPAWRWRAFRELAEKLKTPLAAGEDTSTIAGLEDLLESVSYLRMDATCSGGYSVALRAAERARVVGAELVPHVFPHIHAPLCAAHDGPANAEFIHPRVGADPIERLLSAPYPIVAGQWILDDEQPGLALPLDWNAVRALAVQSFDIGA